MTDDGLAPMRGLLLALLLGIAVWLLVLYLVMKVIG